MPLMNLPSKHHKQAFMKAVEKFNVTDKELEKGFWLAYADHYTPASGIEFRHIYKHVQIMREKGEEFTSEMYDQMYGGKN